MSAGDGIAKNSDLKRRIFFTLGVLIVYRIGVHVPTPGVDGTAVMEFFKAQSSGILGLFNTFSGGALNRFSIFALGIMPYISSSIIFQLLQSVVPYLEALKKEGEQGRRKLSKYTRYGTLFLAIVQGYGISAWLSNSNSSGHPLVVSSYVGPIPFWLMTIVILSAGTCFIMWLGEQISEKGIGNGSSMIIFAGIVAGIFPGASNLWTLIKTNEMNGLMVLLLILFMIVVVGVIIFLEVGQRKIPIQYSGRVAGRHGIVNQGSHLPLKINFSGVIPPIFASSLLMFPATMAQIINTPWLKSLQESLSQTGAIHNILLVVLIVFFSFFYTEIVFNPNDVADNLKKHGGFIPGIRAGKSTADYIQRVLERLNVGGAIYLSVISILPIFLNHFKVPFYFGGTSLLILVGVALDTSQQVQSHLISQKYDGILKKVKVRSRRVQY